MRGFSQVRIWAAIDALAKWRGLSPSGLARLAGLDPTAFNRSKRQSTDGRPRWLSTESLAKVLEATEISIEDFIMLMRGEPLPLEHKSLRPVPLVGSAEAGASHPAEAAASPAPSPAGPFRQDVLAPADAGERLYALAVHGDSMLPLYRNGDILIIDPVARAQPGNRVVARLEDGELLAKILKRCEAGAIVLESLNPAHPEHILRDGEVAWMARVVWASQ